MNLVMEAMQPAGLVLAVRPGPDLSPGKTNAWQQIIPNVLRSCTEGGLCVFASFYEHEVQAIEQICLGHGRRVDIRENPFYLTDPEPVYTDYLGVAAHPLRFIVIVSKTS